MTRKDRAFISRLLSPTGSTGQILHVRSASETGFESSNPGCCCSEGSRVRILLVRFLEPKVNSSNPFVRFWNRVREFESRLLLLIGPRVQIKFVRFWNRVREFESRPFVRRLEQGSRVRKPSVCSASGTGFESSNRDCCSSARCRRGLQSPELTVHHGSSG
uniref:Uncharacterized protein n=1 Tax=Branchiostoma floridae TaxID=7739 RepID=C3YMJ4_BRAFL|eukprot:XP_002602478.1 hypothetical protein BRAFLDRAFT_86862 [Branchiostoma floridae]